MRQVKFMVKRSQGNLAKQKSPMGKKKRCLLDDGACLYFRTDNGQHPTLREILHQLRVSGSREVGVTSATGGVTQKIKVLYKLKPPQAPPPTTSETVMSVGLKTSKFVVSFVPYLSTAVKYGVLGYNMYQADAALFDTPISLKITALPVPDPQMELANNTYAFSQLATELEAGLFTTRATTATRTIAKDVVPGAILGLGLAYLGIPEGVQEFLGNLADYGQDLIF